MVNFCSNVISFSDNFVELFYSDEGSLDSPSDHPPMSPKVMQSPEEIANIQNGDRSTSGVKIRRYFHIVLALSYIYTKPLIDIWDLIILCVSILSQKYILIAEL